MDFLQQLGRINGSIVLMLLTLISSGQIVSFSSCIFLFSSHCNSNTQAWILLKPRGGLKTQNAGRSRCISPITCHLWQVNVGCLHIHCGGTAPRSLTEGVKHGLGAFWEVAVVFWGTLRFCHMHLPCNEPQILSVVILLKS